MTRPPAPANATACPMWPPLPHRLAMFLQRRYHRRHPKRGSTTVPAQTVSPAVRLHPAALVLVPALAVACGTTNNANKNAKLPVTVVEASAVATLAATPSVTVTAAPVAPTLSPSPTPQPSPTDSPTQKPAYVEPQGLDCPDGYPIKYSATGVISILGDGPSYRTFQPARCYDTYAHAVAAGGKAAPPTSPTPSVDTSALDRAELELCVHSLQPLLDSVRNLVDTPTLVPRMIGVLQVDPHNSTALAALAITKGTVDAGTDAFLNDASCPHTGKPAMDYLTLARGAYAGYDSGLILLNRGFGQQNPTDVQRGIQMLSEGDRLADQVNQFLSTNGVSH
jgi:hypothetical protein